MEIECLLAVWSEISQQLSDLVAGNGALMPDRVSIAAGRKQRHPHADGKSTPVRTCCRNASAGNIASGFLVR